MSENDSGDENEIEKPLVAKTAVDLQRLKLMKLMKNPDKPIIIPERPKTKNTPAVPEFVRNVMGSSAGAGSGEFHVYRHLRRKEYSRQKYIQEKGQKELLDEEYHNKLEQNKSLAEAVTAKKRAKRLKRKQKLKLKKLKPNEKKNEEKNNSNDSDVDNESSEDNEDTENEIKKQSDVCLENGTNNDTSNINTEDKEKSVDDDQSMEESDNFEEKINNSGIDKNSEKMSRNEDTSTQMKNMKDSQFCKT